MNPDSGWELRHRNKNYISVWRENSAASLRIAEGIGSKRWRRVTNIFISKNRKGFSPDAPEISLFPNFQNENFFLVKLPVEEGNL
jgi:hypothetical protein